jgi:hypothetical protein
MFFSNHEIDLFFTNFALNEFLIEFMISNFFQIFLVHIVRTFRAIVHLRIDFTLVSISNNWFLRTYVTFDCCMDKVVNDFRLWR